MVVRIEDQILTVEDMEITKKRFLTFKVTLKKTYSKIPLTIQQSGDKIDSIVSLDLESRFKDYPIAVLVSYVQPTVFEAAFTSGAIGGSTASKGVIGVLILTSINAAVSFIKILQILDLFLILNVELPSNTQAFLTSFNSDFFEFLPNFIYSEKEAEYCRIHYKLRENGLECMTTNNIGLLLQVFTVLVGLKIVLYGSYILMKIIGRIFTKKDTSDKSGNKN